MKTKVAEIMSKLTQNLPETAFLLFSIRLTLVGANIGDALAFIAVTGYIGYKKFLSEKSVDHSSDVSRKLTEIENFMSAQKVNKAFTKGPDNEQKVTKTRYF